MHGRGKKINPVKNFRSAEDFDKGKRLGRTKQVWVVDDGFTEERYQRLEKKIGEPIQRRGHWEKVNATT